MHVWNGTVLVKFNMEQEPKNLCNFFCVAFYIFRFILYSVVKRLSTAPRSFINHFLTAWYSGLTPKYLITYRRDINHTVPTFSSCTKCLGSPGIIHDRTLGWQPVSFSWMLKMTSQLNIALLCKLDGSLMYLAYFIGILSTGLCTPRHRQTSGRLVQELNVCTVPYLIPNRLTYHSPSRRMRRCVSWSSWLWTSIGLSWGYTSRRSPFAGVRRSRPTSRRAPLAPPCWRNTWGGTWAPPRASSS